MNNIHLHYLSLPSKQPRELGYLSQYNVWLQTGRPGSISGRGKGLFLQPLCPDQERPGRDADHSPPSTADVKKE
jgi:hypothetical protein